MTKEIITEKETAMSYCPFFKNGYFAACVATTPSHVPSIDEMEQFCFDEDSLCPVFESYKATNFSSAGTITKPAGLLAIQSNLDNRG